MDGGWFLLLLILLGIAAGLDAVGRKQRRKSQREYKRQEHKQQQGQRRRPQQEQKQQGGKRGRLRSEFLGTDQEWALTQGLVKCYGADRVFSNILIPWHQTTSELDIVLLLDRGIVVIEAKDYSGAIYGEENALQWVEYISGHKYSFYNPIKQNATHLSALAQHLGVPADELFSYIVFDDACDFKRVPDNTKHCVICYGSEFFSMLYGQMRMEPVRYTAEQLTHWAEVLTSCKATKKQMEEHINDIKTKCPWCGGELVQRFGTNGYFYGCSNYPHCRYTRNV